MPVLIIVISIYLILIICTSKTKCETENENSKVFVPFIKIAVCMVNRFMPGKKRFMLSEKVANDFKYLYPAETMTQRQTRFVINKLGILLAVGFLGCCLGLCVSVSSRIQHNLNDGNVIKRNEQGKGSKAVTLIASVGEEKHRLQIEVNERKYTEEEFLDIADRICEDIFSAALGNNESYSHVSDKLDFLETYEDYPFELEWSVSNPDIVLWDGSIAVNIPDKDGVKVNIELLIKYDDKSVSYGKEACVCVHDEGMNENKKLEQLVKEAEENQSEEEYLKLPATFENRTIVWEEEKGKNPLFLVMGLLLLLLIAIYFFYDYELHNRVAKQQKELRFAYPELVTKLILFMGAGASVREAWKRIVKEKRVSKCLWVQMMITYHELEEGYSETDAFVRFGKRCREQYYLRFSSLITQNLKRGSGKIIELLNEETREMQEDRKSNARRKGEEAGTKLLLPMVMLLFVVMIIIMAPAFLSM